MADQRTEVARLTQEQLDDIVRRLVAALSPQRIYAFGSHVYGAPHEASDVDVLIILEDATRLRVEDSKRVHEALAGLFVPIELHFRSADRFDRRSRIPASLEHEVATKGRLLYAA